MHGWHFAMISEVPVAAWIVLIALLVILAVVAIRNVARLRFFGGRGQSHLDPLEERLLHGRVRFEEYEEAKEQHTHAHVH